MAVRTRGNVAERELGSGTARSGVPAGQHVRGTGAWPVADQAVDTGGVKLSGHAAPEVHFLGRTRELKELRADIERAGLDTIGPSPSAFPAQLQAR